VRPRQVQALQQALQQQALQVLALQQERRHQQ
jgi:hypothetical protein